MKRHDIYPLTCKQTEEIFQLFGFNKILHTQCNICCVIRYYGLVCTLKALPLQACTGPEGSRRLRLPDFKTFGTWRWQGCQPYAPAAFNPRNYSWHSFLLEAESTPGPNAAGRIMSMKNSNGTIGNQTRDLPVCSAECAHLVVRKV